MTIVELFHKYLGLIWRCFEYDIHIYTRWWMYAFILVPAIGYTIFFFLKWVILFAPIWYPLYLIMNGVEGILGVFVKPAKKKIKEVQDKKNKGKDEKK